MNAMTPGQMEDFANAADAFLNPLKVATSLRNLLVRSYAEGVADALRLAIGNISVGEDETLTAIAGHLKTEDAVMNKFTIVIETNNPVAEAKVRYWADKIAADGLIEHEATTDTDHDTLVKAFNGTPADGVEIFEFEFDSSEGNAFDPAVAAASTLSNAALVEAAKETKALNAREGGYMFDVDYGLHVNDDPTGKTSARDLSVGDTFKDPAYDGPDDEWTTVDEVWIVDSTVHVNSDDED